MIDVRKNEPLRVRNEGRSPYMTCSKVQLEDIKKLLDQHGVYYWLDPVSVSFNNEPATIFINFGQKGDRDAIQAILDSVA